MKNLKSNIYKYLLLLIAILIFADSFSQSNSKLRKKADDFFNNEEFVKALPYYLKLDSIKPNDFEIKYYIGACYFNTRYEKTKGIPYLEYALEHGSSLIPRAVNKDLGTLYHLNYQFDEAIKQFNRYIKLSNYDDENLEFVDSIISVCNYAKEIVNDSLIVEISKIKSPINTELSEHNPLITADESYIYFTRIDSKGNENIYYSSKHLANWKEPKIVEMDKSLNNTSYSIAGLSPDGLQLFLTIGTGQKTDIYTSKLVNGKCTNVAKLNQAINSNYWEGKASITPDGATLYFSSNRQGGYGGKDIYKVYKDIDGNFSNPINLGPDVNTKFDEDAPFIHPDGQTLYFSSNGHKTIGGFDIYKTFYNFFESSWAKPQNVGYPINSTSDDLNFVLSADGNTAYYSSNIGNVYGNSNLFKVSINKTVPLTLIKGVILGGDSLKPLNSRIRIVDNETNKQIKYVYNPNPETGKYLMIFPPNKNYDMIIEAEGYVPHVVNIYVPNQVYFYELFQEISLSKIKLNNSGDIVGQEITVTNTFYDIYNTGDIDTTYTDTIYNKDYSKLLELIEDLIEVTDTIALEDLDKLSNNIINNAGEVGDTIAKDYDKLINLITDAIETTDTMALQLLDRQVKYNSETIGKHFYGEKSDTTNFNLIIIGDDTIKTAIPVNTNIGIESNIEYNSLVEKNNNDTSNYDLKINKTKDINFRNSKISDRKYITSLNVYFKVNNFTVNSKFNNDIEDIVKLVKDNCNLGIEINGYSDTQGSKKSNYVLSNKRALSVLKVLISNGVQTNRNVLYYFGESKSKKGKTEQEKQYNRRVEIKIFEIINN